MTEFAQTDSIIRDSLNRAGPNTLADLLRKIKVGSVLEGHVPQHLFNVDMDAQGADAGNVATLDALVLPDGSKANTILRAFAKTGSAGTGELTIVAPDVTPATGEIGVAPNGNIVSLAADALTSVDILYVPQRGDVLETAFPVVSDAIVLPASITSLGVVALLDVNAVEATLTGRKLILTPGGVPAAGQASLDVAKAQIDFQATDAVTRATVKLLLAPGAAEQLQAALQAASDVY